MKNYFIRYVLIFVAIILLFYWGLNSSKTKQVENNYNSSQLQLIAQHFFHEQLNREFINQSRGASQFKINGIPATMTYYSTTESISKVINDLEKHSKVGQEEIIQQQFGNITSLSWIDKSKKTYNCYLISRDRTTNKTNVYPSTLYLEKIDKRSSTRARHRLKDLPNFPEKPVNFHLTANDFGKISDSFIHVVNSNAQSAMNLYKNKMFSLGWNENVLRERNLPYSKGKILHFNKETKECMMSFMQLPNKTESMVFYTVVQK